MMQNLVAGVYGSMINSEGLGLQKRYKGTNAAGKSKIITEKCFQLFSLAEKLIIETHNSSQGYAGGMVQQVQRIFYSLLNYSQ
jgi:hypothetical protein